MATYFERYRAGAHEEVWQELSALGAGVFEEPVHGDALAVARETMRRARRNVEMLIARLTTRGYCFANAASEAEDRLSSFRTIDNLSNLMTAFASSRSGSVGDHARNVMDRLASVQAGLAPMLERVRAQAAEAASADPQPPLQDPRVFSPPDASTPKLIARLERETGGPLPLSLRAWYEEVGGVSLLGSHPLLNPAAGGGPSGQGAADMFSTLFTPPPVRAPGEPLEAWYARMRGAYQPKPAPPQADEAGLPDPLVVYTIEELLYQLADREPDDGEGTVELVIAPDDLHKADISGDAYYLRLPDARADFRFGDWHRGGFVDYLRAVFRWGGFPGWERAANPPRAEIAALTEGLLPI